MLGLLAFVLFCEFQWPERSPFKTDRIGLLALFRDGLLTGSGLGGLLLRGSLLGCCRHFQELLFLGCRELFAATLAPRLEVRPSGFTPLIRSIPTDDLTLDVALRVDDHLG